MLNKLKSGNWCLNDRAYSKSDDNNKDLLLTQNDINNKYLSEISFYYDSNVRLSGKAVKEPTLKCNGTVMDKFGDNTTPMYVGTLTADELVYAGGKYDSNNTNYYLNNNNEMPWWTLSLHTFNNQTEPAFLLSDTAFIASYSSSDIYHYLVHGLYNTIYSRPAIILALDTEMSSGNGTIDNPYIIN